MEPRQQIAHPLPTPSCICLAEVKCVLASPWAPWLAGALGGGEEVGLFELLGEGDGGTADRVGGGGAPELAGGEPWPVAGSPLSSSST